MQVSPKDAQEIADRLAEIKNQMIWSKEDQGEWRALVWALGVEGDRVPPWEGDEDG